VPVTAGTALFASGGDRFRRPLACTGFRSPPERDWCLLGVTPRRWTSVDGGVRGRAAARARRGGALAQVGDERLDRRLVDRVDHAVQRRRRALLINQPAALAQPGGDGR